MAQVNPVRGFRVDASAIDFIGTDLQRPECILAEPDGTLWAADARGGVVRIATDGHQEIVSQSAQSTFAGAADETERYTTGTLPNGLAFARNGDFIIANFGTDRLELMSRDGRSRVLHETIDGEPIGKTNFVLRDSRDRLWLTVSTRIRNWMDAFSPDIADGYIALVDERGIRIVADGFAFTNEIRFDAKEEWLYVVETTAQRITRLRVQADGTLTDREVFGPGKLGQGGFPDGIAFDAYGNLWGTLIMSDVIFALTPEGDYVEVLVDGDPAATAALESAFHQKRVTPELLLASGGQLANWFASVTFGGPDLKTCYIGSLRGTRIPFFTAPVAGLPMVHWREK
ncbi:MAG: SMP-30/gluconolactonase/LRE family protein [Gammaproteobacteria bacterium]